MRHPTPPLEAFSRGVDWLTASVSTTEADRLLTLPEVGEVVQSFTARAIRFQFGERRACYGGQLSRRWEPLTRSRRWGTEFESWEWDGGHADWFSRRISPEASISRVDLAWDLICPEDYTACDFAAFIRPHVERARIVQGVSGEGVHLTRYVGAASSPRRVRIYRKDIQRPGLRALGFGGLLRVELVLRGDEAKRWWRAWNRDGDEAAFRGAADAVHALTGYAVQPDRQPLPQLEVPEVVDVAQGVFQFLQQYASLLEDADSVGLDLVTLAREMPRARATQYRQRSRLKAWQQIGGDAIASTVRSLMQHASR